MNETKNLFLVLSDNVRKHKVPPEFPGDVLLEFEVDDNENHLPEMY